MTPDRRLDQLEPLMADVLQKTDRLIEGQGKILDVAVRADQNAETTARGVANLTIEVNEFRQEVRQGFGMIEQKLNAEINGLRQEMNQRFDQLIKLIENRLS